MQKKSEMKVYFNGLDYYVANSGEHAQEMLVTQFGEDHCDHEAVIPWESLAEDKTLGVDLTEFDDGRQLRKCSEWVKIIGVGYLCSVDY